MALGESRSVRVSAVIVGLLLCGSGLSKLALTPMQVTHFVAWGLPHWFLILVGTFEVTGGVLLIVPALRPLGAAILSTIMVGALWTHVANHEWLELVPSGGMFLLLLVVLRGTRQRAIRLLGGA